MGSYCFADRALLARRVLPAGRGWKPIADPVRSRRLDLYLVAGGSRIEIVHSGVFTDTLRAAWTVDHVATKLQALGEARGACRVTRAPIPRAGSSRQTTETSRAHRGTSPGCNSSSARRGVKLGPAAMSAAMSGFPKSGRRVDNSGSGRADYQNQ